MKMDKKKLGFQSSEMVDVLDLRCPDASEVVDNEHFFPGWHMNKKHWYTVILDGSVDTAALKSRIETSRELAK